MSGFDLALWACVAALALGAAALSVPRPPRMDWERLLKLLMITRLRGEVEAEGGDEAAWLARGRALVHYHPAARDLFRKLTIPAEVDPPVPALPGERALLDALVALPSPGARVARVFGPEAGGDVALYDDPALLGPEWDLAAILGPGAGWEAVAAWDAGLLSVLARRSEHLRWVLVAKDPERPALRALAEGLGAAVGAERVHTLPDLDAEALVDALAGWLEAPADRLVLLGEGDGALALAKAMEASPGLRDRVRAVVAVGGALGGEARAWLDARFTHEGMDTEIARAKPYFHLAFLDEGADPPGVEGLPLDHTAWPEPGVPENGRRAIEAIDLGTLPGGLERGRPELLGRCLALLILARLAME